MTRITVFQVQSDSMLWYLSLLLIPLPNTCTSLKHTVDLCEFWGSHFVARIWFRLQDFGRKMIPWFSTCHSSENYLIVMIWILAFYWALLKFWGSDSVEKECFRLQDLEREVIVCFCTCHSSLYSLVVNMWYMLPLWTIEQFQTNYEEAIL